jgi:hypothetical protein
MPVVEKLKSKSGFKSFPDRIIAEYTLPVGTNESRQVLTDNGLCLKIVKTHSRKSKKVRYEKTYYFAKGGKLISRLGSIKDMSYKQALEALSVARSQKLDSTDDRKLKTSVRDVFNLYMLTNERKWAAKRFIKNMVLKPNSLRPSRIKP